MSKNDVTGDEIKSKVSSKAYEDNFDRIFRKDKVADSPLSTNQSDKCPTYPEPCFCTGACKPGWDEDRIDVIGQNGNTGEHYDKFK